jgi:hypothetical protein
VDRVKTKHYDKETWQGIVESMRAKRNGPALTDDDVQVLATYLSKNFGPVDAAPAEGAAPAGGAAPSDAELKTLVENTCSSCHGVDLIEGHKADKANWEILIKNMVAMGANLKDEQVPVLAEYLAKTYK